MSEAIPTGAVHHICLTVNDVARSQVFYTSLLGFQFLAELSGRVVLTNGATVLVLGLPPDGKSGSSEGSFDENHIGLDHLSLAVNSVGELHEAATLLRKRQVSPGDIREIPPLNIAVLAFRDPDNIQIELTAPLS